MGLKIWLEKPSFWQSIGRREEGAGAGFILISPDGHELTYARSFEFKASNNEAEYEALIAGLKLALKMGQVTDLQ